MVAFGLVASENSDKDWALARLQKVLEITGKIEVDHLVTERLAKLWKESLHNALRSVRFGRRCCWASCKLPHRFPHEATAVDHSGLGIEVHSGADHQVVEGQLQRKKKHVDVRGLNRNDNQRSEESV